MAIFYAKRSGDIINVVTYKNNKEYMKSKTETETVSLTPQQIITREKGVKLNNKGLYYKTKCKYKKAIKYYKKAIREFYTSNLKSDMGIAYFNIGSVYQKIKKYDIAVTYYKKAISLIQNGNSQQYLSLSTHLTDHVSE